MTFRFVNPLASAWPSMYAFCVRELEKAVTLEPGSFSAKNKAAEPHPHLFPSPR